MRVQVVHELRAAKRRVQTMNRGRHVFGIDDVFVRHHHEHELRALCA